MFQNQEERNILEEHSIGGCTCCVSVVLLHAYKSSFFTGFWMSFLTSMGLKGSHKPW